MGSLKSRIKTRIPALRWRDEQLAKHARRIKDLKEKNAALEAKNRALRRDLQAAQGAAAAGSGGPGAAASGDEAVGPVGWRVTLSGPAVHGVGLRQWLKKNALGENVDGWVRNRSDGKVEALLFGQWPDLERVHARLHNGPRKAEVTRVSIRRVDTRARPGFRIRDDRRV